jgi:hypothetical protein
MERIVCMQASKQGDIDFCIDYLMYLYPSKSVYNTYE